jgi:small-conductance mechanosensitive channel
MSERRVVVSIGVTYQTPHAKLASVPGMIRGIIRAEPEARFDRAHFKSYDDSALTFEVVYHILDPDYNRFMDVQQRINVALFQRFELEGIDFAYPTRTVYVRPAPAGPTAQAAYSPG